MNRSFVTVNKRITMLSITHSKFIVIETYTQFEEV